MNCKARHATPFALLVKALLLLCMFCSCQPAGNLASGSQENRTGARMESGTAQTGNNSQVMSATDNSSNAYNVSATDVSLIEVTTDSSGNDSLASADVQAATTSAGPVILAEELSTSSSFLNVSDTNVTGCRPGYRLVSGGVCTDVDECLNFTDKRTEQEEDRRDACGNYVHSHRPGYRCVNTPGSFRCERLVDCGFGYVLNETSGECIDIDECAVLGYQTACGTTLPIKVCINLDGTFRCEYRSCPHGRHLDRVTGECKQCPRGFAKKAGRGSCVDVNECERPSLNSCPPHMRCANYEGGYECKHKIFCSMGRRANYNGTRCIDIDECTEQPGICGLGHNCVNTDGSYQCESKQCGKLQRLNLDSGACFCIDGFRMNATSRVCEDINECSEGKHNCDVNDVCRNTRGHFDCLSRDKVCEPGFGLSFDTSTCVDIDECKLGQFKCGQHEFCNNTYGSYTCLCYSGFQRLGSDRGCTDVDECAADVSPCPAPLLCANSVGSFACRCPAGFRAHSADPSRCLDIDECQETPGVCGSSGRCLNSPSGAYSCQCSSGYMANETVGGTCVDIDECKLRACPARAVCSNSPGGYDCNCGVGFKFVRSSNECEDIDECSQAASPCQPGQSCFNYRGNYACYNYACPTGFLVSSTVQKGLNSLSFSCQSANASCQLVASLHGNSSNQSVFSSRPLCVGRHRTVHKAQEVLDPAASGSSSSGDSTLTIQSDMRQGDRVCQFKATLTRRDNSSLTVYHRDALPQASSSALQFQHRKLGKFTICSTKLKLSACLEPNRVVKVQLLVALVGRNSAEISDNTIHIVQT